MGHLWRREIQPALCLPFSRPILPYCFPVPPSHHHSSFRIVRTSVESMLGHIWSLWSPSSFAVRPFRKECLLWEDGHQGLGSQHFCAGGMGWGQESEGSRGNTRAKHPGSLLSSLPFLPSLSPPLPPWGAKAQTKESLTLLWPRLSLSLSINLPWPVTEPRFICTPYCVDSSK